jgi:O-antigen/teichoic acid export membrane protein
MAIVMMVIGFSQIYVYMGVGAAIVHRRDITKEQLSSLYWLNIATGLLFFIIISGVAPFISTFYSEPKLKELIVVQSVTFIITSFGNQYKFLFQKNLQFELIAKIEISASISASIIAIFSAMQGYGVYSLVFASISTAIISTICNIFFGFKIYRPSFIFRYQEIKSFLSFGMFQMGENTLNYFNSQFDVILIGKLLGIEALGIYSVAKTIAMRPANIINPIITRVTFPIMAQVQDDIYMLKSIYLKTINYISIVNFPIYVALIILAKPIVLTLFGDKWSDSIIIMQLLSIYAAIRSIGNPVGSLQLARGRADMGFYWNLGVFFIFPLTVYMGSFFGLEGISIAISFLMILGVPISWKFMIKPLCNTNFIEFIVNIIQPLILSLSAGAISLVVIPLSISYIWQILFVCILGFTIYIILLRVYSPNFIKLLKGI